VILTLLPVCYKKVPYRILPVCFFQSYVEGLLTELNRYLSIRIHHKFTLFDYLKTAVLKILKTIVPLPRVNTV